MTRQEIEQLRDRMQRCLKYDGPYTLASGQQAAYYYDGKGETLNPSTAWLIGRALVDVILDSGAEAVGGLEIGSIPIGDAIGLAAHIERGADLPTFIVRKTAKSHGTRSRVNEANLDDGSPLLTEGRRVAIVDDVITTGGSIQQAIDVVRELGCVVTVVVALVERHESKGQLQNQGFPVLRPFYTNEQGALLIDDDFVRRAEESSRQRMAAR